MKAYWKLLKTGDCMSSDIFEGKGAKKIVLRGRSNPTIEGFCGTKLARRFIQAKKVPKYIWGMLATNSNLHFESRASKIPLFGTWKWLILLTLNAKTIKQRPLFVAHILQIWWTWDLSEMNYTLLLIFGSFWADFSFWSPKIKTLYHYRSTFEDK